MSFISRSFGLSRSLLCNNSKLVLRKFSDVGGSSSSSSGGGGGRSVRGLNDILASPADQLRPNILGMGDYAFQINDVLVRQSVILLPDHFLMWNAKCFEDITIKSLSLFPILYPTVEVLFIGTGETYNQQLPKELITHFRKKGIVIEASSTSNAAATFNMLSSEGRKVACALLTLQPVPDDYYLNEFD